MENGHCVAVIHAEANAILQAAKNGVCINNSAIYVTASPCWNCFKMIANSGIKQIIYREFYRDERIFVAAKSLGIVLNQYQEDSMGGSDDWNPADGSSWRVGEIPEAQAKV
jgi:dCMP deaminase